MSEQKDSNGVALVFLHCSKKKKGITFSAPRDLDNSEDSHPQSHIPWSTGNFAKTTKHSSRDNCQHWINVQEPKKTEGLFMLAKAITHRVAVVALELQMLLCFVKFGIHNNNNKKKINPQTTQKCKKSPPNV